MTFLRSGNFSIHRAINIKLWFDFLIVFIMFESLYQHYVEHCLQSAVNLIRQYTKFRLLALILFSVIPSSLHLELFYLPHGECTSQISKSFRFDHIYFY